MLIRNSDALLVHLMEQRKNRMKKLNSAIKNRLESVHDSEQNLRMTETRIYVGLNDAETKEQKYETEQYVDIMKDICRSYHVAFSMDIEEGGYYHEDGTYTEETSLVLVMIGIEGDIVQQVAKELCERFHQESVLITENQIRGCFVSAKEE